MMAHMHSPACYVLKVFNDNTITCKLKYGHHPCGEGRFRSFPFPHNKLLSPNKTVVTKLAVLRDLMLLCGQLT